MTYRKKVIVECDGCGEQYHYEGELVLEAERRIIENGWVEDMGEHYCPYCEDGVE